MSKAKHGLENIITGLVLLGVFGLLFTVAVISVLNGASLFGDAIYVLGALGILSGLLYVVLGSVQYLRWRRKEKLRSRHDSELVGASN